MVRRGDQQVFPRRLDTNVAGAEGELTTNVAGTKAFIQDGRTPGGVPLVDAIGSGLTRVNGITVVTKRPVRIIGVGDSIMQSNSNIEESGTTENGAPIPPNWNVGVGIFEQTLWKANGDPDSHCQYMFVSNRGIAGETTQQILNRFDTDVIAAAPDAVFIIAGTNDILTGMLDSEIAGTMNRIEQMIMKCVAINAQVFLCTPPPKDEAAPETQNIQPFYYLLARAYSIPLLDINRLCVNPTNGAYKDGFSEDGVHPLAATCDMVATEFAKALIHPEHYINRPWLAPVSYVNPGGYGNLVLNGNFAQGLDDGGKPLAWDSNVAEDQNTLDISGDTTVPYTGQKFLYTVPAEADGGQSGVYGLFSNNINFPFSPGDALEFAASYKQTGMDPATSIGGTWQVSFDGPFGASARPINTLPVSADMVVYHECYVPQQATTINVQLYSQDYGVTYTLQNVTLLNRSFLERIWTPGQQ